MMPLFPSVLTWYRSISQSSAERLPRRYSWDLLRYAGQGDVGVADYRRPVRVSGRAGIGHLLHAVGIGGVRVPAWAVAFQTAGTALPFRSDVQVRQLAPGGREGPEVVAVAAMGCGRRTWSGRRRRCRATGGCARSHRRSKQVIFADLVITVVFPEPTFPIWLKSFLSNSSMVFQPLSNYGPFCVFPAIITP